MVANLRAIPRELKLTWVPNPVTGSAAAFLWGPRQTGKSTWLRATFPDALSYDLLDTDLCADLLVRPKRLREEVLAARPEVVVLDEIQKVPALLEEVHWLLENTTAHFVLCGSSARKLRRKASNLLGGRAIDCELFPLTTSEVPDMDLGRVARHGALPAHYFVDNPKPLLRAYVNNYIKEEIIDEAATRNVPAFTRFLQVLGLTHGQQLNYTSVARETGVSASTVRSYFQILEDTLLGFTLEPWRRTKKRRLVETAKFWLFDVGVANHLNPEVETVEEGSSLFGRAFEHFLLNEVRAYRSYRGLDFPLSFWRTSSGFEVDLILGQLDVALEFKASRRLRGKADLRGLRTLVDEHGDAVRRKIVVSREDRPRRTEDGIEILPWRMFCEELWAGGIVG